MSDLDHLRNEVHRLRRELATAFQQSEQVVLDLSKEITEQSAADYTGQRLNLMQANRIRNLFLRAWQELSKED